MENTKIKELFVTVIPRTNNETGEQFDTYKVYTNKGFKYDLRFTKDVPEDIRPTGTSYIGVELDNMNLQKRNRTFPILWVQKVEYVTPLNGSKNSDLDELFSDAEVEEEEEVNPFAEDVNEEEEYQYKE